MRTYANPQDPTQVAISFDVPDLGALLAMLQSDEGAEAMEQDGVNADTVVLLVEA